MTPLNTQEKFWSLAEPIPWSGCWIWLGGDEDYGYGRFSFNGVRYKAHRLAYELTHGVSTKGQCVCHKCDVRLCVNPDHLFIGSRADNMRDMWSKGRGVNTPHLGEKHGMAILTEKQVLEIRSKYTGKRGELTALGLEYGVDYSTISLIVKRRHWKHI